MVETRVFCDRCHERITQDRSAFKAHCGPARRRLETVDLCDGCFEDLAGWIKTFPHSSQPAHGTPDNPGERAKTARAAV